MLKVDLLVAGGGPAGCAAAVAARRAAPALSVAVVDAARFPRDKLCAGAITGGGLRELELAGLALRVPHAVVTHVRWRIEGRELRRELPRPAAVVRRIEFDADLVDQARRAGAEVIERAPLSGLRAADGVAETGAGPVAFRTLLCADGVAGPSRRLLGLGPGRRAPLREALSRERGQEDLLFDLDAGVAGYAWRFPCLEGGRSVENAGVYAVEHAADLGASLRGWAGREGLSLGEAEAWSLRVAELGGPVGRGRALLAGEALGVDPLTGEGIRYALWSGRIAGDLAARALAAGRWPSLRAYRARLAATRSGALLALCGILAPRLHRGGARWRRAAADRAVVEAMAALVSGAHPARPIAALLARYRAAGRALP